MNISKNKNSNFGPDQQSMMELETLYKLNQYDSLEKKVKQLLNKYNKNINLYIENLKISMYINFT